MLIAINLIMSSLWNQIRTSKRLNLYSNIKHDTCWFWTFFLLAFSLWPVLILLTIWSNKLLPDPGTDSDGCWGWGCGCLNCCCWGWTNSENDVWYLSLLNWSGLTAGKFWNLCWSCLFDLVKVLADVSSLHERSKRQVRSWNMTTWDGNNQDLKNFIFFKQTTKLGWSWQLGLMGTAKERLMFEL